MRLSGDAGRPSTQNYGVKKRHLGERTRKLHYAGDIFGAGKQSTTQEEWEEHTKGWWNHLDHPRNTPLTVLNAVSPLNRAYSIQDTSDGSRSWNFW